MLFNGRGWDFVHEWQPPVDNADIGFPVRIGARVASYRENFRIAASEINALHVDVSLRVRYEHEACHARMVPHRVIAALDEHSHLFGVEAHFSNWFRLLGRFLHSTIK